MNRIDTQWFAWSRSLVAGAVVVVLLALGVANIALYSRWNDVEDGVLWNTRAEGLTAIEVAPGSAASSAGIERGDVLVAADGARSTIRALLLGDGPTPTGNAEMHGTVPTPPDAPSGVYRQIWGPGAKFGFYPVRNATCWYCTVKASDPRFVDQAGRKEAIRARLATYPAPTLSLADAESEHPITRAVLVTHDLSKPWVHGRVALLGDAAHAMAPHLGQGAGQAIEDAAVLADCLRAGGDVTAALRAYEHRRKGHVRGIAKQSRILGKALVLENPLAHSIWRTAVKLSWPPIGSKQYVKIHRYEP